MVDVHIQDGAEGGGGGLVGEEAAVLHLHDVVVRHSLLLGTGDGVVVLELSLSLAQLHDLLQGLLHRHTEDLGERQVQLGGRQLVHHTAVDSLGAATRGVVTSPVGVGVRGVGHEVSLVHLPLLLVFVHGLDVVAKHGVLHVHSETVLVGVHVLDELVHVGVGNRGG